jgi:hypothetical protein
MAQRAVLPLGLFYSPFIAQPTSNKIKRGPIPCCQKCKAAVCRQASKGSGGGKWVCPFCDLENPNHQGFGSDTVEESQEGKTGECGLFFIVDLCVGNDEMEAIRETMVKTIRKLPEDLNVGMATFNKNVMLANFDGSEVEYVCLNGSENYPTALQIF